MMQREYRLIYLGEGNDVKAALGFRVTEHLHFWKSIYIDD